MSLNEFYGRNEDYLNILNPSIKQEEMSESTVVCPDAFLAFKVLRGLKLKLTVENLIAVSEKITKLLKSTKRCKIKSLDEKSMYLKNDILMN